MAAIAPEPAPSTTGTASAPSHTTVPERPPEPAGKPKWLSYLTPIAVLVLTAALIFTLTRNWNAWEGGRIDQVPDDAYVRGGLTPLRTKVLGIVSAVHVSDYQQVHKGDLILELEDKDYQAQVDQANAAIAAARAAINNNLRQRQLQDAKIAKALQGIDLAKAQIAAAEAGREAIQAGLTRARSERKRQEALYESQSATQQKVEAVVADEESLAAQMASREADLAQTRTGMRSSELSAQAERIGKTVLLSQEMQLQADLRAKQASFAAALVALGYTKIFSPGEGTVGERQVRPGQLVSPGTQVISFVDMTKWVQANYRETQLTNVKVGDPAEIRIDKYPGETIHGKIIEIAPASGSQFALLPPDNSTGNFTKVVQRIPVKIVLDDANLAAKLQPGLSATATVRTRR